jgi:hypothetical protein
MADQLSDVTGWIAEDSDVRLALDVTDGRIHLGLEDVASLRPDGSLIAAAVELSAPDVDRLIGGLCVLRNSLVAVPAQLRRA